MERQPLQAVVVQDQVIKPSISSTAMAAATSHPASSSAAAALPAADVKSSGALDAATLRRMEEKKREALQRLEERRRQQMHGQNNHSYAPATDYLQARVHSAPSNSNAAPITIGQEIPPVRSPAKVSPTIEEHRVINVPGPSSKLSNPHDQGSGPVAAQPVGASGLHVFETGKGRAVEVVSNLSSTTMYGVNGTIGGPVKSDISVKPGPTETSFSKEAPPPLFSTIPASWTQKSRHPGTYHSAAIHPPRPVESAVAVHPSVVVAAAQPPPVSAGGGRPVRSID
jgi:hypothetical protein